MVLKKSPKSLNTKIARPERSDSNLVQIPAFHPDQVLRFSGSLSGKHFQFSRSAAGRDWESHVFNQEIQERLNLLARIHRQKYDAEKLKNQEVDFTFELQMAEGAKWTAVKKGNILLWSEGPFKDAGIELKRDQSWLLSQVLSTTAPPTLVLCPSRIQELALEKSDVRLRFANFQWTGKKEIKNLGTQVEEWFSKYCTVRPQGWIEGAQIEVLKELDTLTLRDSKQNKIIVGVYLGVGSKNLAFKARIQDRDQYFTSEQLELAYGELKRWGGVSKKD
jgi:hypothetical protein